MRTKLLAVAAVLVLATAAPAADLTKGTPDIQSAQALAFGPNGLLFVGDPQGAAIFAIDTGDAKKGSDKALDIPRLDAKVASILGAADKEVRINDMKVNPASGNLYIAATRGTGAGQPAIVRITRDGNAEAVSLKDVMFAKVTIPNPGKNQRDPLGSITSMAFVDGKLIVAGLSSEEFASTLRVIPYPFAKETDKGTAIEIFHGAHNAIETRAPIRTFVAYKIDKQDHIMAAYTCTPLVKVPVSELKPGVKVKGVTIAELGSGNQPLDMIAYAKDGKDYLLIANTSRGVMKVPAAEFGTAPAITTKPTVPGGVKYDTVTELKGVVQLDKLDDGRALILVRVNPTDKANMAVDLKTIPLP